jgi:diguanylate cyclase (GGDEF)-like protein
LASLSKSSKRPSSAPRTLPASDNPDLAREVMRRIKAPHRPTLVVLNGNEVGARVVVDHSLTIGRDPDADLVLSDAMVSWHHARIEDRGDSWTLIDLESTNGVSVNGEPRREWILSPNDRIVAGSTGMLFELQDGLTQAFNENVEYMLNIDDLSGLFVRRKFDSELERMVESARVQGESLALLVMDLDGVKKINDTHGHLFGAYVIGEAGRVIGRVIHGRGVGCRFGGDEYLAALPSLDAAGGVEVAESIRAAIASHRFLRDGIELEPGISLGVAAYPADAEDAESLFQAADKALYRAKQAGKNRVCR